MREGDKRKSRWRSIFRKQLLARFHELPSFRNKSRAAALRAEAYIFLGDCLSRVHTFLFYFIRFYTLFPRGVWAAIQLMHITYILYIEILKFFITAVVPCSRVLLAFLSAAYILSDVVNGNDDGICWHDLLQGGGGEKGSACCPPFIWLEASNVFFRRLYT